MAGLGFWAQIAAPMARNLMMLRTAIIRTNFSETHSRMPALDASLHFLLFASFSWRFLYWTSDMA
jgi:hypothetical protein